MKSLQSLFASACPSHNASHPNSFQLSFLKLSSDENHTMEVIQLDYTCVSEDSGDPFIWSKLKHQEPRWRPACTSDASLHFLFVSRLSRTMWKQEAVQQTLWQWSRLLLLFRKIKPSSQVNRSRNSEVSPTKLLLLILDLILLWNLGFSHTFYFSVQRQHTFSIIPEGKRSIALLHCTHFDML